MRSAWTHPPAVWEQIEKFDLDKSFWEMVKTTFGYADEEANLKKLLVRLFVTDYAQNLKGDLPASFANLVPAPIWPGKRRGLSGSMEGQQQQGQQLRPAFGRSGGDSSTLTTTWAVSKLTICST